MAVTNLVRTGTGWPPVKVNEAGHLVIGEIDAVRLAREYGTPLYVFDEAVIRRQCRAFKEAVGQAGRVAYAGKAFLCQAIIRIIDEEGLLLDVVSGGELHTALDAGFPAGRIVFHGNNKSEDELRFALEGGVGRVVVDNLRELDLLEALARSAGRRQPVLLRVAPGIEAHTHEYVNTGQEDSKFGFDVKSGQALAAARRAAASPDLDWLGLHCHVGSQIFEIEPFRLAVRRLMEIGAEVRHETGESPREIDIGGGFGIRYVPEDRPPAIAAVVDAALDELRRAAAALGLPVPQLYIEPGRAIVGEAGYTLYTVGAIKRIPGVRTYVSVDGGMADNPRPAMYGAVYTAVVANRAEAAGGEPVRLVGRYCESGDVLIREVVLPDPAPGDVVAVFSTGAYHYTMASNYNRFPRPAAVLVNGGEADLIIARETFADLVRQDRVPPRLAPRAGA